VGDREPEIGAGRALPDHCALQYGGISVLRTRTDI
jgi:hypothetical protein